MEEEILISYLNDFIFCPISIYYHKLYGRINNDLLDSSSQINGKNVHDTIDKGKYSTSKNFLQGIEVYSNKYRIIGKIDIYDKKEKMLIERKNLVKEIYDGYIYQLYAEYYSMEEMGYKIEKLRIHSYKDNKNYNIKLPKDNKTMKKRFDNLIKEINSFDYNNFKPTNRDKCLNCIYNNACPESLI